MRAMESLSSSSVSDAKKEELINQFQQQFALAHVQELITKMVEKCFKICITKPGATLDGSEQKCLAMCMDRFMDSYTLVTKTYANRLERESHAA